MDYQELIEKVLKGRKVAAAARDMGISQPSLSRYAKEERMPDCDVALMLIEEAGVDIEEGLRAVAQATKDYKKRSGFASPMLLFGISIAGIGALQFQQEIVQMQNAALIGGGVLSFCLYYVKYAVERTYGLPIPETKCTPPPVLTSISAASTRPAPAPESRCRTERNAAAQATAFTGDDPAAMRATAVSVVHSAFASQRKLTSAAR